MLKNTHNAVSHRAHSDRSHSAKRRSGAQASRQPASHAHQQSRWPAFFAGILVGLAASWLAPKLLQAELNGATNSPTPGAATQDSGTEELQSFNFPQLFKDNEVVVPESEQNSNNSAELAADFYVQVGSFRSYEDADSLRVKLLLLNLDTAIEPVKGVNGLWHRVVVGPFASGGAAEQARNKLHQNNIQTLLLKRSRP